MFRHILTIVFIFIFVSPNKLYSAVFYMKNGGTKTVGSGPSFEGNWSDANCFGTLYKAFHSMVSGDVLIVDDGVYVGSENMIYQHNYPPSGTPSTFTVIKARNIPGQNGVPKDQPLKVKFTGIGAGFSVANYPSNDSSKYVQYVQFEGIRWNGVSTYINWDHLYFKQCASQGISDGNSATFSISGQNNLLEDVVAFGKGRYKILFYDPSRETQSKGDGNNLCRRCIVRQDWAMRNDVNTNPIAGIASYFNRGTALLNTVVIDSDLPEYWQDSPMELSGAFYQPNDTGPHKFTIKGSIVLNTAMAALYLRLGSTGHVLEDVVANKVAGGFGLHGGTTANRLSLLNEGRSRYSYRSPAQANAVLAANIGLYGWSTPNTAAVKNSILLNVTGLAVANTSLISDYLNIFNATSNFGTTNSQGNAPVSPHLFTTNPLSNGLMYPLRIETASTLLTGGEAGGQIGARILYKLGKDGTFKGDTDWDTAQGALWPWPLEEWVQAEMRSMDTQIWSDGVGQVSPYDAPHFDTMPDPNRGFCANGQTLTNYIWGVLDNTIPPFDLKVSLASPDVILKWRPNTDANISGYKVYVGTTPGVYNMEGYVGGKSVGKVTSVVLNNLPNTKLYFSVTSVDSLKGESGYSYEVAIDKRIPSPPQNLKIIPQ